MKILFIGLAKEGSLLKTFEKEFIKIGHKTEIFDCESDYTSRLYSLPFTKKNRFIRRIINYIFWRLIARETNKKTLDHYNRFSPDLVIIFKGWQVSPSTIKKMKKHSKVFCWTGDDPLNKKRFNDSNLWIRRSIHIYDAYFIWSKYLTEQLKRLGVKAYYLPCAYDGHIHYPLKLNKRDKEKFKAEVSFIGTWDVNREEWLSELSEFDLKIWGNSWENASKEIQKRWTKQEAVGKDFSKICAASKVIINFVRKPKVPSHNMKTFEIPACKGFQLSNRTSEILSFFKEGEEIACFTSKEEMKKKIRYYLNHEKERKKIIEGGFKRVRNQTYETRAGYILKVYDKLKK